MNKFGFYNNKNCSIGDGAGQLIVRCLLLLAAIILPTTALAQDPGDEELVMPFEEQSIVVPESFSTNHEEPPFYVKNLLQRGEGSRYFSGDPTGWTEPAYIEFAIRDGGLSLYDADGNLDNDHLVLYIRRAEEKNMQGNQFENDQPTTFLVKGLFEGTDESQEENWLDLCWIYLLYRGSYTMEFSSRVAIKKFWMNIFNERYSYIHQPERDSKGPNDMPSDPWRLWTKGAFFEDGTPRKLIKMRFYVEANHNRNFDDKTGFRTMVMSRFDVIRLDPSDSYPGTFADRLHLDFDYIKDFEDYEFENTTGIVCERESPNYVGRWSNKYADALRALQENDINITMPSFDFITSENSTDEILDPGQKRQPTHTVEHVIYAVPGDVVALYPYYQLWQQPQYEENFAHWYNYKTGGRLIYNAPWSDIDYDLLDFAIDPTNVFISKNYGFYAMQTRYSVSSPQEYIAAIDKINNSDNSAYIELTADLDFEGFEDIPMLGHDYTRGFRGFFNGNGHTIKNLVYNYPDKEGVGFVAFADNNTHIENVIIDSSCRFEGGYRVGLVGFLNGGALFLNGVHSEATIIAHRQDREQAAGGILGYGNGNSIRLQVNNCYIGGQVGDPDLVFEGANNAAVAGWMGTINVPNTQANRGRIENLIIDCDVYGSDGRYYYRSNAEPENEMGEIVIENCYTTKEPGQEFAALVIDENGLPENFTNWTLAEGGEADQAKSYYPPQSVVGDAVKNWGNGDRETGTYATFFCPRNPYTPNGTQHRLFDDFDDYDDEFVIAADFSQEFEKEKHIQEGKIIEPIIFTRHLFRIRSGKAFADEFSGSKEMNENYVRKNQTMVSARAGVPFQIRFDSPVPEDGTTRSNYYYKINDAEYRRVCAMNIRVLDPNTREELTGDDAPKFYMAEPFTGKGSRNIDGVKYELCGGSGRYFRMLRCDNATEGNYIVQLIGKDVNGDVINVYGEDDYPLVVMEYNISFLPSSRASLITEEQLYGDDGRFRHAREEVLKERFGDPKTFINFDEYIKINKIELASDRESLIQTQGQRNGMDLSYFKWPVSWKGSSYSFGYNIRHDFNMYMLATHSEMVPYKGAASQFDGGVGLFDRTYYQTKRLNAANPAVPVEQGYFYYVNAASDPGVAARLTINDLCPGSTIHVSAWVAEFSDSPETANVSFNFVAVLKEDLGQSQNDDEVDRLLHGGDRIVLHSFVTGYVPGDSNNGAALSAGEPRDYRGEWLNVYYSFVPRLSEFSRDGITSDMVDHYELEIDNNCKSSVGADYAIDNIQVYLVKPVIYASQLTPLCNDEKSTNVKVESQFDTLLQTVGEQESVETSNDLVGLYYTILDKNKFDKIYNGDNGQEAFNASVVKFDNGINTEGTFGHLTFSNNFTSNPVYDRENVDPSVDRAFRYVEDGERMIVFNCNLSDDDLLPGKDYYVALATAAESTDEALSNAPSEGNEWLFFDITSPCSKICTLTVRSANVVKIDGILVEDYDQLTICENQSPVVQVNLWGKENEDSELKELERNGMFDWFNGSVTDFDEYELNGVKLSDALIVFREYYPEVETLDGFKLSGTEQNFTSAMLDVIKAASSTRKVKDASGVEVELPALLVLRQSSYVFPPISFRPDEAERICKVVAIPIVKDEAFGENDKEGEAGEGEAPSQSLIVCTAPTEVRIKAVNKSPHLFHGLLGIAYPERLSDVPIRMGLDHLRAISADMNSEAEAAGLVIPVRLVSSSIIEEDKQPSGMKLLSEDTGIILVQTNDPEYKDLGEVIDEAGNSELLEIGKVVKLQASLGQSAENMFKVIFDKKFNFKEGYYYRMRFQYEEDFNKAENEPSAVAIDDIKCDGQDVFTIKVVPQYQMWVGGEGANWNNDANWRRVSSDELLSSLDGKEDYVSDYEGYKNTTRSYVPLDFTKVIIPAGKVYPQLGERMHSKSHLNVNGTETVSVVYETGSGTFDWSETEPLAAIIDSDTEEDANVPSELIHYDMVYHQPAEAGDASDMFCRPWYGNTADQIHFNSNAEILNQQNLDYQKAWVDMELTPGRWYTVGMPLQGVLAGDMYLPSKSADEGTPGNVEGRQNTELFSDITFNKGDNDRFSPAVYQRGWDKGDETVFRLQSSDFENDLVQNVAVAMTWSHVYNDVTVGYHPGSGFSIKNDISRLTNQPDYVKFRFPKADTRYDYYEIDSDTGHVENGENLVRTNPGRLTELDETGTYEAEIRNQNAGNKLFLVGNPFMSHLDMAEFLTVNADVVQPKYWILTEDSQLSASLNNGNVIGIDDADASIIAPMQGFFVEAKNTTDGVLKIKFTAGMMKLGYVEEDFEGPLTRSAESGAELADLVISNDESRALVFATENADKGYEASEDVQLLDDKMYGNVSRVFTIAGNIASVINRTSDLEGLEIGVLAPEDVENTIRFNANIPDDYYLYDASTGEMEPLYPGLEKSVKGTVSRRLFITKGSIDEIEKDAILISGHNGSVTVTAPESCGAVDVKVYNTLGQLVGAVNGDGTITVNIGNGIYFVDVTTEKGIRNSAKLAL